jgi:hypothetical protein
VFKDLPNPRPIEWCGKAYHTSNPIFRDNILEEGLTPQIGDSYKLHYESWFTSNMGPVIFLILQEKDVEPWCSTYDDDIWEIQVSKDISLFEDPSMKYPRVYTKKSITPTNLKLIYRGTGE